MEFDSVTAERAAANEESQHDCDNEPSRPQGDLEWHKIILHVNGSLLPGFDLNHIRSMATDDSPGLRVEFGARPGPLAAALLFVRLQIKCGETWHVLAKITIPIQRDRNPLSAHLLEVGNTKAIKTLFTIPSTYISSTAIIDPTNGLDFDLMKLGLSDLQQGSASSRSSTFIQPQSSQIIFVAAEANPHEVFVDYPSSFWRQIHRQPMTTRTIANRIRSVLASMDLVKFWITFPLHQEWRQKWRLFFGDEHKESPYGSVTWERCQTDSTPDDSFRAFLIPYPDSRWIKNENDKQEYGIDASGLPTAYLMAVNINNVKNIMPDIGTFVKIDLAVAQGYFEIPKQPQTPLHIRKIALEVQGVLKAAENRALQLTEESLAKPFGFRDKETIAEDFAHLISEIYIETASKGLKPYINKLSNKAKSMLPSGPEDAQRWVDALEAAYQLRARGGENDNAHVKRIAKWIKSQGVITRTLKRNELGEPFLGCRMDPPCDIPTEVALFHLQVPKQPDWPHGFKDPPLRIAIPKNVPTDETPISVFKLGKNDFFFHITAKAVEVHCNEICAVDNLELDPIESDQLEATIRKLSTATARH